MGVSLILHVKFPTIPCERVAPSIALFHLSCQSQLFRCGVDREARLVVEFTVLCSENCYIGSLGY